MADATQAYMKRRRAIAALALDCPGGLMTLARYAAAKAIKRQLQARREKIAYIEHREIVEAAKTYLQEHPELIEEAAESVWSSKLRTPAEREDRERRRNRR